MSEQKTTLQQQETLFKNKINPVFESDKTNIQHAILIDDSIVPNTIINDRKRSFDSFMSEANLDNPDQRITQDVDALCKSFSTILPLIIVSPFVIAWYTYQVNLLFLFKRYRYFFLYIILYNFLRVYYINFF